MDQPAGRPREGGGRRRATAPIAARWRSPPRPALALLAAALAAAAACNPFRGEPPPCPRTAILGGADTVAVHRVGAGDAATAADIRVFGALTDVAAQCRYEDDAVAVDIALAVVAEKGPAYTPGGGPVELTYFVAVVGPGGDLLGRETLTTAIDIPEDARRAGVAEELTQIVPGVEPARAAAYRILLGFRLSEEEVRRRRGERPSPATAAPPGARIFTD